MNNLEARYKVGEVPERIYKKQVKSSKKKIDQLDGTLAAVHKNWFERHINWTYILGILSALFFISIPIYLVLGTSIEAERISNVPAYIILIFLAAWYLRQKGRHWRNLLWLIIPVFGLIIPLCLDDKSSINGISIKQPELYRIKTWKSIVPAVLSLLAGGVGIWGAYNNAVNLNSYGFAWFACFSAMIIWGGYSAIKRKRWGWSLAASILSFIIWGSLTRLFPNIDKLIFIFLAAIPSITSILFTILSKNEFT